MPGMDHPITAALSALICGAIAAIVVTMVSKREEHTPHERAAEPYVGFLYGAIIGAVCVMGLRVIL